MAKSKCNNCYLYVLDTMADWEIGYITAELNSGRYLNLLEGNLNIKKIANTLDTIKTMGGISITPDNVLTEIKFEEGDLLILPGADTWMDEKNQSVLEIVSDLINRNVVVAAICGATVALASKGILNNRRHTSIDKDFLKMICPEYLSSDNYVNAPAVVDGCLITATGLAPLEFSYEVFKKISVMKEGTLEAWYKLYKTREARYFYDLMESLK